MYSSLRKFLFRTLRTSVPMLIGLALFALPIPAYAQYEIVDAFDLSPMVPMVLDALMQIATGGYDYFVGAGTGIIYVLVWGFLAASVSLYLVKMYFPKIWVSFFGFSGGGEMASGKMTGETVVKNVMQPGFRALIAAVVLLQIKPVYMTQWLINPFLQFGAIYTHAITETINDSVGGGASAKKVECPDAIIQKEWISRESCEFLVQPVADLSHANNQIIKRGFEFIVNGLRGLITLVPHGGEDFLNLISGILLVTTFVSSNLFMALLIIQGIFNFGMALVLYPFQVLIWVAKPKNPDKLFDVWPAFSGITKSLQQLIITMIACAFILCINLAIIKSLFQWSSSIFVVAAGGTATSNVPQVAHSAMGFGNHSILWLSSILTFYLMLRIFELTRERLNKYVGAGMDNLYKQVNSDRKVLWKGTKDWGKKIVKAAGWIKKK